MTGIFVRIQRDGPDGPWKPVDIDEMSNEELDSLDGLMARRVPVGAWMLWMWVKTLAKYIRDHREEDD